MGLPLDSRVSNPCPWVIEKNLIAPECVTDSCFLLFTRFIEKDDLSRFMRKEQVEKLLAFFPGAKETGKIRKLFFKIWLENVHLERKSVIRAFKDTKTCIDTLDKLGSALFLVLIIILGLLLTGLLTTPVQIFISSQLLLLEFIFGNAAKDLLEAIVFVCAKHPFDVGDRCDVDGVEMEVAVKNILTTVFLTNDGEKKTYPNSVLASKPISNFNRSPPLSESVEFKVDFSASDESLGALKDKIQTYLDRNPNHWHPDPSVVAKEILDGDHLKMVLHVTPTMNFLNARERAARRSDLVLELKKILEELHLKVARASSVINLSQTAIGSHYCARF
ncbi:mechanosensitive ion channel protein 10 [Eucalyptus grandis]|uniref:mechanosensitive ion channel protein 10 n=1 Tax=Eucalyptus grandis TaxID=71139 RepID=UPI00192F04AE|nr:mechanosensitive ion channel protein 10 [Eucalyptus grandis]